MSDSLRDPSPSPSLAGGGLNPLTWLLGNAALLAFLLAWRHPLAPLVSLAGLFVAGALAGVGMREQIRRIAPFLALALAWMVTSAIFYQPSPGESTAIALKIGSLAIRRSAATWGALRAYRLLDMIQFGSLLTASVRADDLALALAQNLRVPYRIAFALQAAYRMVPLLSDEAERIRRAQIVRGVPVPRGPLGAAKRLYLASGPLLAGALRRADRMALAMECRGFGAEKTRTYRRRIGFGWRDGAALALFLAGLAGITILDLRSFSWGWSMLW